MGKGEGKKGEGKGKGGERQGRVQGEKGRKPETGPPIGYGRPWSSVSPSVTLVDCYHVGWNTLKIIYWLINLYRVFSVCRLQHPKFQPKQTMVMEKWLFVATRFIPGTGKALKLQSSNFERAFMGSIGTKSHEMKIFGKVAVRSQGIPKIFRATVFRSHRSVNFAIARLSCYFLLIVVFGLKAVYAVSEWFELAVSERHV